MFKIHPTRKHKKTKFLSATFRIEEIILLSQESRNTIRKVKSQGIKARTPGIARILAEKIGNLEKLAENAIISRYSTAG